MRHDFSHVTAAQLAELFPLLLVEHDPQWPAYYIREKTFLEGVFGKHIIRINHFGSSSVPGLLSKPTVDILLEVAQDIDLTPITETMLDAGYVVNTPPESLILYLKGYTPRGFEGQAVHIHVRLYDDWGGLYFRDYLVAHPDVARAYAKLKRDLKELYTNNRDGYTEAKGAFIAKYTELARAEFPGRYCPA